MSEKKRSLSRIPAQGKVAGVCAGVGEYLGIETWLVRVVVASSIILTGVFGLPLLAYVVACFLLDTKKEEVSQPIHVKAKIWQSGEVASEALRDIQGRYAKMERRLQKMERHVTSPAFQLKREFDKL